MSRQKGIAFMVGVMAAICLGLTAAAGVFAASAPAIPAAESEKETAATVGEFATQLAAALQLPGPKGGFTAESASLALWKVGVKVGPDFRKPLRESDITATLAQIGLNLTSDDPDRLVTSGRSSTIIGTFVSSSALSDRIKVNAAVGDAGDDFNNGNGKGGKFKNKGHRSPGSEQ